MNETPEHHLPRMLADRWRIESGEQRLSRLLSEGSLTPPVAVAALDLDGSGPIRARGIEAKIRLVEQFQLLVAGLVPDGAILIDSGTRDEAYVVLPRASARLIVDIAERIRASVAAFRFEISGPDDTVSVTTSVGCAVLRTPRSGADILASARAALFEAKKVRDHVHLADPGGPPESMARLTCHPAVLATIEERGADMRDVLRTGLWTLQEKHGPVWHWVAVRGGAVGGRIPDLPRTWERAEAPRPAKDFFELLVRSVALEAALESKLAAGHRYRVTVEHGGPAPAGHAMAARYLPGEWVLADPSPAGSAFLPADVFQVIESARNRGDAAVQPVTLTVPLTPDCAAVVEKARAARGRAAGQLLGEALGLGVDHLRAWQGTSGPAGGRGAR